MQRSSKSLDISPYPIGMIENMAAVIFTVSNILKPRQAEAISRALAKDAVIIYPTETGYALGCALGSAKGVAKIRQLRKMTKQHLFTLLLSDLKSIGHFSYLDNASFRLVKAHIPGPFTFILRATAAVPKLFIHPKRKSMGFRVPSHSVVQTILSVSAQPLLSVSLYREDEGWCNQDDIMAFQDQVDCIVEQEQCQQRPGSVIDMQDFPPTIIREGYGDCTAFK